MSRHRDESRAQRMNTRTRPSSAMRSALLLLFFVLGAGTLLLVVNRLTTDRIQRASDAWLQQNLMDVMSEEQQRQSPSITLVEFPDSNSSDAPLPLYRVSTDSATIASILTVVAPDGYNGSIDLLVGIDRNGAITGVRVTRHRETPGLGDDIDIARSDWIRRFDGLSLDSVAEAAWSVKRPASKFDAFTGATITPRAVVNAVHQALLWYSAHQNVILN